MSGRTDTNLSPIMRISHTNVKHEINELSTNKKLNFLENIVPRNETSEQKPNE
jgi:hypothetical protein